MEKIRISTVQALMLGISSVTVTGHLLLIPVIITHAGRDVWLSLVSAILPTVLLAYVISVMAKEFPRQTLVEYVQEILGKWPGRLIAGLYILYFFHDTTLALRGFGEFYTSAITPRTPIIIYFSSIMVMAVYAVRGGLEVLARTNQIFLVIMIPIGLTASILTQKDKDYANFLPIMEFGPLPMVRGLLDLMALFGTFVVLSMILPHIHSQKRLKKSTILSSLILVLMFVGPLTGPIAIFGPERSSGLTFPTFQILRDMEVGELQRLDLIGIALWSMGAFAKISVFLYATILGITHLFKLDDYRSLAIPTGALMVIVALINADSFIEIYRFYLDTYPYVSVVMGFILPILLFIILKIKNRLKASEGQHHVQEDE